MSKRFDLREFQQRLLDKLRDKNLSESRVSILAMIIAGQNWLVDMSDISEVLPLPQLAVVPFSKQWFCGVVNVRGKLYGVTDMAAYLNNGAASGDINNRILLVAERYAFNAALLVDRVLGARDVRAWKQSEVDGEVVYRDEQDVLWRKLDIPGLLEQAEFLQVEAVG